MYKEHNLRGGHVIKLGPGNDAAAEEALDAWSSTCSTCRIPFELRNYADRLHIGGGITQDNCQQWIDAGAEKVVHKIRVF